MMNFQFPARHICNLGAIALSLALVSCGSNSTTPEASDSSSLNGSSILPSSGALGISSGSSSATGLSSSTIPGTSSSSVVITGTYGIAFLKANNPSLFKDIVFELQSDSSYTIDVAHEVNLSNAIPTFNYTGSVTLGAVAISSGVTAINLPDESTIAFDGKLVSYHVKRHYTIPTLRINTANAAAVASDSVYIACSLQLDGKNMYADYSAADATIKLRGNSTKVFYDKKPYRLKLGSRAAILGMKEDKDWVLLANYRDPTNFMNAVVFDMARYMNLPYTNSNRFVEVYMNDSYIGMYQLTEQIEEGANRVPIDSISGLLLNLDLDDGPDLAPNAGDNFSSTVYTLPVCVKSPKNQTAAQLNSIKTDFAVLENLIKSADYTTLATRLDIPSLIDFLIIQELTRNVELVSPRSMYMYKNIDNIYHFGPVWDFDGGFAFDWASMETGHEYFSSQSWVMGSSNPSRQPADAYAAIPGFFVDLFANAQFVAAYKARWTELSTGILPYAFTKLDDYSLHCDSALTNNATRWPIGKDPKTEIQRMKNWLTTRVSAYSGIVAQY